MDSESDYEMTEDQRLGMLEIQKLQQELDDADGNKIFVHYNLMVQSCHKQLSTLNS